MTIKTIIFDFGGVVTNSPIEGFKELENTKLSPSIKTFFEKAKKFWGSNK